MNEKGSATTANGGTCAFIGKDSWGMAWTNERDPKRRGVNLKGKVMLFRAALHVRDCTYSEIVPLERIVVKMG